jgi:polysaccharide export outer membrane protein
VSLFCFRTFRLSTLALVLPLLSHAQLPSNPVHADQPDCTGPLAALIPDCQAHKGGSTDIGGGLPRRIPSGITLPPTLKVPATPTAAGPAAPARREEPNEMPAQPTTEFQRYAASSTGEMLPIFGSSLFERVPTTFAPLDRVPVTADYVIGPGDEVLLRAWGQVNLDLDMTVDRVGAVFIPQVGNISVAGIRYQQLPGFMKAQLERVFRNFDLNVNMGQLRSIEIFVVGQVRRPGTYTVSSLSTLVNALFASGGPSAQGSMRHIQLKREGQVATEFDLYDLLLKGDKTKDRHLLPGDVVYIPPAGPQVAVAGSVKNPAVYELNGEKTAGDIIQLAGGLSAVADGQRATLERIHERNSLRALEFPLNDGGLATEVRDGDVIRVLTITPKFANVVTLRGNVANPGRFPWHEGMRLADVIPDKESLITRDYWTKRNTLGFSPRQESIPGKPNAEEGRKLPHVTIEAMVPDINWSYAVVERQSPEDLKTELIAFNLGKLVLEKDQQQNLPLRPADVVTVFSQADVRVAMAQQTRLVKLEGEIAAAGVYAVHPGETLGRLVQRAGGLTSQAYLYGSELQRDSTREEQQRRLDQFTADLQAEVEQTATLHLSSAATAEETAALTTKLDNQRRVVERLRQVKATGRIVLNLEPGDNSLAKLMDVALENGDRFVVPTRPATVNVLGAVYNQNAFLFEPDQRIGDYLRSAGGPTRTADTGHTFVIRADGSVVPRRGSGLFKPGFETGRLNPGDSVMVPEQIFKGSFMRGLRDWTAVFSQLALGAAAINILR